MIDRTGQKKENVVRFSLKENSTLHKDPIRKTKYIYIYPDLFQLSSALDVLTGWRGDTLGSLLKSSFNLGAEEYHNTGYKTAHTATISRSLKSDIY